MPADKLSKVMFYTILCDAVLYSIDNSIIESISPILHTCSLWLFFLFALDPKTSLALRLLRNSSLIACPISVDFTTSLICSMKICNWTEYSVLFLAILISGLGRNRSILYALQPKVISSIGECITLFLSHWIPLRSQTALCTTCKLAFRSFLNQLPFNHTILREITQSTLFFHAIYGYYRRFAEPMFLVEQTPNTKRSRIENSAVASVSSRENCIQSIGENGAMKPKSLLNRFLASVQSVIQKLDDQSVAENFFEFLRSIVEVCWDQCQVRVLSF